MIYGLDGLAKGIKDGEALYGDTIKNDAAAAALEKETAQKPFYGQIAANKAAQVEAETKNSQSITETNLYNLQARKDLKAIADKDAEDNTILTGAVAERLRLANQAAVEQNKPLTAFEQANIVAQAQYEAIVSKGLLNNPKMQDRAMNALSLQAQNAARAGIAALNVNQAPPQFAIEVLSKAFNLPGLMVAPPDAYSGDKENPEYVLTYTDPMAGPKQIKMDADTLRGTLMSMGYPGDVGKNFAADKKQKATDAQKEADREVREREIARKEKADKDRADAAIKRMDQLVAKTDASINAANKRAENRNKLDGKKAALNDLNRQIKQEEENLGEPPASTSPSFVHYNKAMQTLKGLKSFRDALQNDLADVKDISGGKPPETKKTMPAGIPRRG